MKYLVGIAFVLILGALAAARSAGLRPLPVPTDDIRLRHKTTDRAFYDDPRRAAGTWGLSAKSRVKVARRD